MSLPSAPPPLSTPSRPRPRPTHRSSNSSGGGGGSFDAAALDSNNPMLAGLSLSGFTPGGPVPAGYSYLDKAAPTLRTSTRSGPRDAAAGTTQRKKAPRPATRFVPPRSTSPVSPHDRAIPSSLATASPSPPRSKTLPSLSQLNTTLTSLASLPANPRAWTPTHVSLYLSHVLSLAPRPIIEDVARFVRSEQLSGPGFLRLREGQLEARGMNPRWRRLLCEASERLRREGLRRRIWSQKTKEEEEGEEPSMEDLLGGTGGEAGELTPGQQRLMTATLKRIRDRKAVRGLIDAIESSPPKDVTDLPPSHAGTPTRKIKKAFPALDGVGSTERSSPTVIEPPFGEGYVRRQANSFSSQENLAKMAREGVKAQRIRPSRTRQWTNDAKESSEGGLPGSISTSAISEFGSRSALPSSVSSPGDLEWAHTHTHAHAHTMSASSSSSSSISTSTSTSSITSALGYESDFSATSESDVADFDDEVGVAGQREEQQQPFWMTTLPIDEEMVRAMLAEQEEGLEVTIDMEEQLLSSPEDKADAEKVAGSADESPYSQSSLEEKEVAEQPKAHLEAHTPSEDQLSIAAQEEELDDSLTMGTLTLANRRLFADVEVPNASTNEDQSSSFFAGEDNDDVFTCQRHEEQEQERPQEYEHDIEATLRAPRRDCSSLAMQSLLLPSSNADEEGERFDTIRLDEDSFATIRQGRRGASSGSGSSQGGEEEGVGGRRGGRRSLQQLSEMFSTPCESAGEEEGEIEERGEAEAEEQLGFETAELAEEAPGVETEEAQLAIETMLEELAIAPLLKEEQAFQEEKQEALEQADVSDHDKSVPELKVVELDERVPQLNVDLAIDDQDDKVQDDSQTTQDDIVVPTLTTQHCPDTDTESSLEDSTIIHLIHTREVSTASSCSPEAFAAAAVEATTVSADTSLLEAKQEVEEHHEHHETSSNPDDDAHIWYGDGSSLLLLSSLLPDRTGDELLISEHRRLLPSRTSSPKDERERRDLPPWSWADLVARTPPYLVGLATGVAFVVVSEMVLGMRRR